MATQDADTATTRMTGAQRRDQILAVARRLFARDGFAATTDEIAREAGVSQPYVVRLFGSKRELFRETHAQATARVLDVLRRVPPGSDAAREMGEAYTELLDDRDLLRVLMHGFLDSDPVVASNARRTLGEAYQAFLERSGGTPEEGRRFVANGMLINVLLAVDAPAHQGEEAGLDSLLLCVAENIAEQRRTA